MFTYADAQTPISTTNIADGIGDRKHKRVKKTGQQGQEVLCHNRQRHIHNTWLSVGRDSATTWSICPLNPGGDVISWSISQ